MLLYCALLSILTTRWAPCFFLLRINGLYDSREPLVISANNTNKVSNVAVIGYHRCSIFIIRKLIGNDSLKNKQIVLIIGTVRDYIQ